MAQFHWKGRTHGGHEVNGSLTAASKEEVMSGLCRQGIAVESIEETRDGSPIDHAVGCPAEGRPAPGVAAMLARERAKGPRRMRGLVIAVAFIATGFALGLLAPFLTCQCDHPADGVVTCSLRESDLGILPLRVQSLADVRSVDIETVTAGGVADYGHTVKLPRVRFVLQGGDGASIHATRWGDSALWPMRADLASWLLENRPGTLTLRSIEWTSLRLALVPMALGVLMLVLFLLSFSRRVTDGIYAAAGTLAAAVDAGRRRRTNPPR